MRTKTIIWIASLLIVVNIGLGVTIYFLMKPEAKTAVLQKIYAIEVPEITLPTIEMPEVELPKIEVTEEDVEAVKDSMKQKLLERAQLTSENGEAVSEESSDDVQEANRYHVEHWGMTFHLPVDVAQYHISLRQDVLTIERHLQVMVYIARYNTGVRPTVNGEWEMLASFKGSDFYVRKGSDVTLSSVAATPPSNDKLEQMRQEVYKSILSSYHFEQE